MRIKAFVILSFVCCLAYSADTTAALSGATRSTQFVTAVDHTKLENGDVSVIAGQDGDVRIIVSGGVSDTTNVVAVLDDLPTKPSDIGAAAANHSHSFCLELNYPTIFTEQPEGTMFKANNKNEIVPATAGTDYVVPSSLSAVATSGSYDDLSDKPRLETLDTLWEEGKIPKVDNEGGLTTAVPGIDYVIPSAKWDWSTQVTNAPAFVTQSVTNGLSSMAYVDSHQWTWNSITDKPTNISSFSNDANYTSGQAATNIARQIIREAVSQVNVNLQSADDTRAALTNLITILKNL